MARLTLKTFFFFPLLTPCSPRPHNWIERAKGMQLFIDHLHTDMLWYILPSSPGHLGKLLTRFKLRSRLRVIRESTSERNKESKRDTSIMYGPGEMYVCLHQALSPRYLLNRCIYKYATLCVSFFSQNRIGISRKTPVRSGLREMTDVYCNSSHNRLYLLAECQAFSELKKVARHTGCSQRS